MNKTFNIYCDESTHMVHDGKLQTSRIIALGVNGLYGGVGDEGFGIIARFIILVDSHHLEVEVADLSVLAYTEPVASNDTAEGRAANRRVEVYISAGQAMIRQAQEGTLQ